MQPAERDMTMKENENATLSHPKHYGSEADPLPFGSVDIDALSGSKGYTSSLASEAKGAANFEYVEDLYIDGKNGKRDSPRNTHQNELTFHGVENDADSLSSETYDKEKIQDNERSMNGEEPTHCNKNETPCTSASDVFETNKHIGSSELQCELTKLITCEKEINCQGVKDTCVDKEMPRKDNELGYSCNNHFDVKEGGRDIFTSDGLVAESTKVANEDEFLTKEESYRNIIARGRPKLVSESFSSEDIANNYDSDNLIRQTRETDHGDATNTITNSLKEESFVDETPPVQEFGTRSFLRSLLSSLDSAKGKVAQQSDQIPSSEAVSRNLASLFEVETKTVGSASNLVYNSKVESGSITFNFNPPSALVSGIVKETMEDLNQQLVHSRDLLDHKGEEVGNLSSGGKVSNKDPQDLSFTTKHGISDDSSAIPHAHCIRSNFASHKNIHEPLFVISDSSSIPSSTNDDRHSNVEQLQYDEGESSLSAAGPIDDSGPISHFRSLSHCSDASTTSGRSFAFPILQSEWNSSPTRMAKADGRHFRRHRGWRSGLLCCRF